MDHSDRSRDIKMIVGIMDPKLCLGCRFYSMETVTVDGVVNRMIRCKRLDCDNWQRMPHGEIKIIEDR